MLGDAEWTKLEPLIEACRPKGKTPPQVNRAGFCGGSNSCEDGAMTKRTPPFSPEVRERAVRMVLEHQGEHDSQYGAIRSIAAKIGCSGETLRNWVRQAERDQGVRAGPTTEE